MNITVIGAGYVGLVTSVCFAELGNEVICVDNNLEKINMLNKSLVPIYEPKLQELILKNLKNGKISFYDKMDESISQSELIIIAVGTPATIKGEANLEYLFNAVEEIALRINSYKIVVIKSTVPVGTSKKINKIIKEIAKVNVDVAFIPEFLKEGSAIDDVFNPDRIIIGTRSKYAREVLIELHKPITSNIIVTSEENAEMIKYASNAFLATKISFINEMANICERIGTDIKEVASGMGMDKRINPYFLNAGIGYGGSCFPKDIKALIHMSESLDYEPRLLKSVVDVNEQQINMFVEKLLYILGELRGKTVSIWGLSFKPNTDDIRESPSLKVINFLLKTGCFIKVYDPLAMENTKTIYSVDLINYCQDPLDAAKDSDAICITTDWDVFKEVDIIKIKKLMRTPNIIDGRNIFDVEKMKREGIYYSSFGR